MITSITNKLITLIRSQLVSGAILILLFSLAAYAQAPGSSQGLKSGDGINVIQGRVHFPSGQAVGVRPVKVSLESVSAFGAMSTTTDLNGVFRFTGLQAGDYTVVVDAGKEYEVARESVGIYREASPGGRTVQIAIILRLKIDSSNPAFAGIPQPALNLYQKGTAAAQKGNAKVAAEFLSKAVSAYPNFPLALSELGVQYMKLDNLDKAVDTYDALLKLKPSDATAHLNLGIALYNQNKLEPAEAHVREALRLNSPGPMGHYYLGVILIKTKRYGEAQQEMERAITNGGENLAQAHKFLGGLYMSSKKNKEAADELERYLTLDPNAKDAETIRGTIKELRSKQ